MNAVAVNLEEFRETGCSGYLVSADGRVYDPYDQKLVEQYMGSHGYLTVFAKNSIITISYLVHGLVATAFVEVPEPMRYSRVIVNHKDGNKTNNVASNLEWETYTGNILHAYATGLRTDNTPVHAKNISTNETLVFNTLNECARHFKVNGEAVHRYLKGTREYFFKMPFILKRENQEWVKLSPKGLSGVVPGRFREVVGRREAEIHLFGSIAKASEYTGVKTSVIQKMAQGGSKNSSVSNGWSFQYLDSFMGDVAELPHMEANPRPKPITPTRQPLKVRVTDTETGDIQIKESLQVLADELGMNKSALQKYVFVNNGKRGKLLIEYIRKQ